VLHEVTRTFRHAEEIVERQVGGVSVVEWRGHFTAWIIDEGAIEAT